TLLPQVPASVIGAEGYFLPPVQGQCVLGSTYEREPAGQGCTRHAQQQIVNKLAPALAPAVLQPVIDAMAVTVPNAGSRQPVSLGGVGDNGGKAVATRAQGAQHNDAAVFAGWAGSRAV